MRKWIFLMLAAVMAFPLTACGSAENAPFPSKEIMLIVPFPAGGVSDLAARPMADALAAELQQPVVLEYISGAGGEVGWTECYHAAPDGYTLALVTSATATNSITDDATYDYKNFQYLLATCCDPYVLFVSTDSGITSVDDLIAYGKTNRVLFAETGNGVHYALIDFIDRANIENFDIVPFDGTAEGTLSVASGDCLVGCTSIPAAKAMIENGQLYPLLVLWGERVDAFPEVPASDELGFSNMHHATIRGFAAPPDTPKEICNTLAGAMYRAVERDDYQEAEANLGLTRNILSGEEFKAEMVHAYETYVRLVEIEQSWNQ